MLTDAFENMTGQKPVGIGGFEATHRFRHGIQFAVAFWQLQSTKS